MAEPSEYEWTMMRFKTSLSLSLKEIKIIEMEEQMAGHSNEIQEKDNEISKLHLKIDQMEKGMVSGEEMAVKSLDGMADLEAKLAFVNNEKNEMADKIPGSEHV